jgi:polyisoprenoid-binding protein YceI
MKKGTLKGKDFFDVEKNPQITFKSTKGDMVFNRKDYGMNKGIPLIKIADHIEVDFHLIAKRVSGPPLTLKQ